jgi:hypothetical protein
MCKFLNCCWHTLTSNNRPLAIQKRFGLIKKVLTWLPIKKALTWLLVIKILNKKVMTHIIFHLKVFT